MPLWVPPSRLYAIVDADVGRRHGRSVPELARRFMAGGARLIQVRAKSMPSGEYLASCELVVREARSCGATIIVNDRADIARLAGAAGVHVGQDDLSVASVRRILGPEGLVGLSTHTPEQIVEALDQPISYLAVGPVFGTESKETGYEPVGLELVRYAATAAGRLPVVAIGGITLATARSVIEAGAAAVAVISDLVAPEPPDVRVEAFLSALS